MGVALTEERGTCETLASLVVHHPSSLLHLALLEPRPSCMSRNVLAQLDPAGVGIDRVSR